MTITISLDPDIAEIGPFVLTWHGLLVAVAVAVGLFVAVRRGRKMGLPDDMLYGTALWVLVGGVVGARALHVIDQADYYAVNPGRIVAVWDGGIALMGGIIGGLVAGVLYARWRRYPVAALADAAPEALLLAQAIGRIGCLLNGDAYGVATGESWGLVYTHPDAFVPPNWVAQGVASHPTPVYEMFWDLLALGAILRLRGRLSPNGMLFMAYLALYSVGRFIITFWRQDPEWIGGLQEAHLLSLLFLAIAVPVLALKARWRSPAQPPMRTLL